eukprot:1845485-Ditylum_brightwellii.AAC.1
MELWDNDGKIRYASAYVQVSKSPPSAYPAPHKDKDISSIFEGMQFYNHIRRLGYEYGTNYQLIDCLNLKEAYFGKIPSLNWISYMDAMLHLHLVDGNSFGYPIGIDKIFFRENSLSHAPLWAVRPECNTIANDAILLQGLRMEYLPVQTHTYSIHQETFIEYGESDTAIDIKLLASLICRESRVFSLYQPLVSNDLLELADLLRDSKIMAENEAKVAPIILSEYSNIDVGEESCLLVTVDKDQPKLPHVLVAKWDNIKMYRYNWSDLQISTLPIIDDWKGAVKKAPVSFVWKGTGSSGAVASLTAETNGRIRVMSYDGGGNEDGPL